MKKKLYANNSLYLAQYQYFDTAIDILAAIGKLKSNLSAGPDGLPPLLFKGVKLSIALPLTLAFRQLLSVSYCLKTGKAPL